ncbi:MAG: ferrous iron transport protein B [Eubacteriaceae bacterium]|nr:ferrous iron transport protein B [Eubacteriaceae bacterium]
MGHSYALTGNPNSGKTTIFNELTGSAQYVGNWSGVTVEKKEGFIKNSKINVVDLPGIYSMSSSSIDEVIALEYITEENPDGILNVVSASNLERNLYLTLQLMEMKVPVLMILNMMDELSRKNIKLDVDRLKEIFDIQIILTGQNDRKNLSRIKEIDLKGLKSNFARFSYFSKEIQDGIREIASHISLQTLTQYKADPQWLALKIMEGDNKIIEACCAKDAAIIEKAKAIRLIIEKSEGVEFSQLLAAQRYSYLGEIAGQVLIDADGNMDRESVSEKIDKIMTHRILAIPIFLGIMWTIYYITITGLGSKSIEVMEWLISDLFTGAVKALMVTMDVSTWLQSLVIDGVIGGVGAVLVFIPQIMILFFFISILEDSGYMARIAFVMDRIFKKFGLSGKSVIPMLVGSGCSVPGIMATRTLENERDRKLTILLTPFISCGAKMPVYLLFVSAFFAANSHWVVFSLYLLGIVTAMVSGVVLTKVRYKGVESDFILEMPPYRVPALKSVLLHMWDKGKDFLIRAGTIIFAASVIMWFAQSFDLSFQMVQDPSTSVLADFGRLVAPVFAPLGFGDWITSVAFITGFVAKEIVISTLSVLHGVSQGALGSSLTEFYTPLSAYSFMVFVLLASPCFAAISVMKRELGSWKETGFSILYQTGTAYLLSMAVYQIGSLFIK